MKEKFSGVNVHEQGSEVWWGGWGGQKISHSSFISVYFAEILQHGIAKAYQIVGDFLKIFKYFIKYSSEIQHDGPLNLLRT